jgi:hypothetical protein
MKQEPGRRQPGITFLQGGENVKILYGVQLCSSVKSPANPFSRMDFTGLFSCFAWQQEF